MKLWTMSTVDAAEPGVRDWYAAEVLPQAAENAAVARAWLIETVDFHEAHGASLPQLIAVYESVDVARAEDAYWPVPAEWTAAPAAVTHPRVTAREVLLDFWMPSDRGDWWCSIRADRADTELARANWERFERWYTFEHVGETVVAPGFHEGWRLGEELGAEGASGFHLHQRWAMYELTNREDMMIKVNQAPLKAIWNDTVDHDTFSRSYHRVVASA